MLGNSRGLSVGLTIAALTAIVGLAIAKPPAGKAPIKKPVADADVATPTSTGDASAPSTAAAASNADAAIPSSGDAGPVTLSTPAAGDGGVKVSPLTPAPNEFPSPNLLADAGATVDYDKLMGDISALRARAAAVGDTLFHSRIAISLEVDGDHGKVARLVVSLDDGAVYNKPPEARLGDTTAIYNHALSPGRHALTVDVERRDDRNDAFRTSQRSRFVVEVPRDQELGVELIVEDDSNMGKNFPSDQSGRYDLHVRMKANAHAIKK